MWNIIATTMKRAWIDRNRYLTRQFCAPRIGRWELWKYPQTYGNSPWRKSLPRRSGTLSGSEGGASRWCWTSFSISLFSCLNSHAYFLHSKAILSVVITWSLPLQAPDTSTRTIHYGMLLGFLLLSFITLGTSIQLETSSASESRNLLKRRGYAVGCLLCFTFTKHLTNRDHLGDDLPP